MVLLNCSIVGEGAVIPVVIEESITVGLLKEAIAAKLSEKRADRLQLFLAKTAVGTWPDWGGAAAVTLDGDGKLQGFEEMNPTLLLKNKKNFGDNFQLGEGQVHVLVVPPKATATNLATEELPVLKRARTEVTFACDELVAITAIAQKLNPATDLAVGKLLKGPFSVLELKMDEHGVATGEVDLKVQSPVDKARRVAELRSSHGETQPTLVFVGDSATDLLAMLEADVGVWLDSDATLSSSKLLQQLVRCYGIDIHPLTSYNYLLECAQHRRADSRRPVILQRQSGHNCGQSLVDALITGKYSSYKVRVTLADRGDSFTEASTTITLRVWPILCHVLPCIYGKCRRMGHSEWLIYDCPLSL